MNEKRYFYTDPLAAAWMAKHFGMKFLPRSIHVKRFGWYEGDFVSEYSNSDPYVLSPGSLPVLEPQAGDLILFTEDARKSDYDGDIGPSGHGIFDSTNISSDVSRVLQRDGKLFHWPDESLSA